ncbi:G patch domain-containing protein 3-like isoform 1-T2 [Rhinophrynus dorsalis]
MPRPHPVAVSQGSPPGSQPPLQQSALTHEPNTSTSRRRSPPEDITFISGSAETPPEEPPCCPPLSRAWATYKAVLCYVITCSRCPPKDTENYLPCSLEVSDVGPINGHPAGSPHPPRVIERGKKPGNSFSYQDVKLGGVPLYKDPCPHATEMETAKDSPAPVPTRAPRSSTGEYYSLRESDPELSRLSGSMSSAEIDVLIWQKLTELFSLHQIDELARCTSETVFLEKSSEITELISSLTQDYQLEEQDAECRLVRGIIRISTRKVRARGSSSRGGDKGYGGQHNSRNGVKAPDSGNETMQESGLTSQDDLDVQISEETTSDLIARNMRKYSAPDPPAFPYKTRQERLGVQCLGSEEEQHVTSVELKRMSELNPPAMMPQGNVGTPLKVFLQLIRSCRFPPRLITKLGLHFPHAGQRYSKVPFNYSGTETIVSEEGVYTASGQKITEMDDFSNCNRRNHEPEEQSQSSDEEKEDDDTCEEWERHEALHEDVTTQERSKERLYEEEIELKWEKGGSGLVFYTDAQLWQEQEGDFDEQTSDDWDVDMSGYYEEGAGDKDARDYLKMRLEDRRRNGMESTEEQYNLGQFEKHTKGFGRRFMERQGWTEGTGLGASGAGMPDALENEGQNPKCKRGLGYHGEKLQTFCPPQRKSTHFISTVYDRLQEEDKGDTFLRRQPHTAMKYRGNGVGSFLKD